MAAIVGLVLLALLFWQFTRVDALQAERDLWQLKARRQKRENKRAARILSVLHDRTNDMKSALHSMQTTNDSLTRLLSECQIQLGTVPFLHEQVKHLQMVLTARMAESDNRVLALADMRVQAQLTGQQFYREDTRVGGIPPALGGRSASMARPAARRDGFSQDPVDSAPTDGIKNYESGDYLAKARVGETQVQYPDSAFIREAPRPSLEEIANDLHKTLIEAGVPEGQAAAILDPLHGTE